MKRPQLNDVNTSHQTTSYEVEVRHPGKDRWSLNMITRDLQDAIQRRAVILAGQGGVQAQIIVVSEHRRILP